MSHGKVKVYYERLGLEGKELASVKRHVNKFMSEYYNNVRDLGTKEPMPMGTCKGAGGREMMLESIGLGEFIVWFDGHRNGMGHRGHVPSLGDLMTRSAYGVFGLL